VTPQALWDQLWQISRDLGPVYNALHAHILQQPVIGVDQTGWPNLESKAAKKWQMWCVTAEDAVYHRICDDKGTASFVELLRGYQGHVVCDALGTHGAGEREVPGIILAGCWAHIARRFRDAEASFPQAGIAREKIKGLYEVEQEAEDEDTRRRLRLERSAPILDELHAWLQAQLLPKTTSLGEAVAHTLAYWPRLKRFVSDPKIWIDNNPTERGLRGPVVGRRNHFGSKSRRGTEVAAVLYTVVETAKLRGVDPAAYLVDAVTAARLGEVRLPGDA